MVLVDMRKDIGLAVDGYSYPVFVGLVRQGEEDFIVGLVIIKRRHVFIQEVTEPIISSVVVIVVDLNNPVREKMHLSYLLVFPCPGGDQRTHEIMASPGYIKVVQVIGKKIDENLVSVDALDKEQNHY